MSIIETFDLSKTFGRIIAVDQVNLTMPVGAIFGITGPAHSGKTTLLRLLATLTLPTTGDAQISGYSLIGNPTSIRRMIGYMPQNFGVYPNLSVAEYLLFFADCYGIPQNDQATLVDDLLQLVDLIHRKYRPIDGLTHGMRQRLSLARALTNDPQILLLDEPFTQVDPRAHVEMRELIRELHNMGKSVIITAVTPADLADLCTEQAVIVHGKIVLSGSSETVRARTYEHRVLVVRFFGNVDVAYEIIAQNPGVQHIDIISSGNDVSLTTDGNEELPTIVTVMKEIHVSFAGRYDDASQLLRRLMRKGVQVVSFGEPFDATETFVIHSSIENRSA